MSCPPHRLLAALLVVVSVLTGIAVYRAGDSGAKAAWTGHYANTAAPRGY